MLRSFTYNLYRLPVLFLAFATFALPPWSAANAASHDLADRIAQVVLNDLRSEMKKVGLKQLPTGARRIFYDHRSRIVKDPEQAVYTVDYAVSQLLSGTDNPYRQVELVVSWQTVARTTSKQTQRVRITTYLTNDGGK